MFTARSKIKKEQGAGEPTELETQVAQALFDLEVNTSELKADLKNLVIVSAKEVDVGSSGKKAIVVFVPYTQLRAYHKIQVRLMREMEKKFSGKIVVFIAQRRILPKITKKNRRKTQKRPRSRTLTKVHEAILEDLVYPVEITGKRTRVRIDGSKLMRIYLDRKDQQNTEYKLDAFSAVYRRLTGKETKFEFPVPKHEITWNATSS